MRLGDEEIENLQIQMVREIRAQFVKMGYLSNNHDGRICIGLSGGVDSTLIALVAHHLGLKVHAISYERSGYPNPDFTQAKKTSKIMGWKFHGIKLRKRNPSRVFIEMTQKYGCSRKTEIECLYPYISIFDKASNLGFDKLMVGFNTTPDGRKDSIAIRKDPKKYWSDIVSRADTYRLAPSNKTPRISYACSKLYQVGKEKGIRVVAPMFGKKYNQIFLDRSLTPSEMNRPYQKSFLKNCFPEEFQLLGMTRTKNLNLQKGGGMTEFFEPIIHDPKINVHGYKTSDVTKCLVKLAEFWAKV